MPSDYQSHKEECNEESGHFCLTEAFMRRKISSVHTTTKDEAISVKDRD